MWTEKPPGCAGRPNCVAAAKLLTPGSGSPLECGGVALSCRSALAWRFRAGQSRRGWELSRSTAALIRGTAARVAGAPGSPAPPRSRLCFPRAHCAPRPRGGAGAAPGRRVLGSGPSALPTLGRASTWDPHRDPLPSPPPRARTPRAAGWGGFPGSRNCVFAGLEVRHLLHPSCWLHWHTVGAAYPSPVE